MRRPPDACASAAGSAKRSRTSIRERADDRRQLAAGEATEQDAAVLRGGDAEARARVLVGRAPGHPTRMRLRHPLEAREDCRADGWWRCTGRSRRGKTTLALHVVAEAQKAGGICAFVDAEPP